MTLREQLSPSLCHSSHAVATVARPIASSRWPSSWGPPRRQRVDGMLASTRGRIAAGEFAVRDAGSAVRAREGHS